jgi:hypothetical protein
MSNALEHLWSQVGHGAAEAFSSLASFKYSFFGEPEISQLRVSFVVDNNVVWFEVAVNDISFVQVLKS